MQINANYFLTKVRLRGYLKIIRTYAKLPWQRYASLSYKLYCLRRRALPEQFCVSPNNFIEVWQAFMVLMEWTPSFKTASKCQNWGEAHPHLRGDGICFAAGH